MGLYMSQSRSQSKRKRKMGGVCRWGQRCLAGLQNKGEQEVLAEDVVCRNMKGVYVHLLSSQPKAVVQSNCCLLPFPDTIIRLGQGLRQQY